MTEKNLKTLKDYLLKGGVKGRTFYHFDACYPASVFFYTVKDIEPKSSLNGRTKGMLIFSVLTKGMLIFSVLKSNRMGSSPIENYLTDEEATKEQLEQLTQSKEFS